MPRATDMIKLRADDADAKMPGASSSVEQARIVADLGIESAMIVALLLDGLTERVDRLEHQVKDLKKNGKSKKKSS